MSETKKVQIKVNHNYGQFSNVEITVLDVDSNLAIAYAKGIIEKLKVALPIPSFGGRNNGQKPQVPKTTIEGKLVKGPEKKTNGSGKPYTWAVLSVDKVWHYLNAYKEGPADTLAGLKQGSIVKVNGEIRKNIVEKDGEKKEYVNVLGIDAITLVKPPQETKKVREPGTDEDGNVLDDIPF